MVQASRKPTVRASSRKLKVKYLRGLYTATVVKAWSERCFAPARHLNGTSKTTQIQDLRSSLDSSCMAHGANFPLWSRKDFASWCCQSLGTVRSTAVKLLQQSRETKSSEVLANASAFCRIQHSFPLTSGACRSKAFWIRLSTCVWRPGRLSATDGSDFPLFGA